jgi:hypothetical protein
VDFNFATGNIMNETDIKNLLLEIEDIKKRIDQLEILCVSIEKKVKSLLFYRYGFKIPEI